ncbi:MAG: proton-conducting transporter membrane subunit [Candidatus Bathyarchaeota archaeon]|nr:proton-conducting transporter membrane subunit [Candidatus Bathyarchaeota archaeon]
MSEWVPNILVVFPVIMGLIVRLLKNVKAREVVVSLTAVILIILSLSLIRLVNGAPYFLTLPEVLDEVVVVLDFVLLAYFLYIGFRVKHPLVVVLALLQIMPLVYFELSLPVVHVKPTFTIDLLSIIMALIICIIGSLICVYALSYMDEHEKHLRLAETRQPKFFLYMLLFLGAMNGLVFANNLYWLYFFWEVTTLCCYQLIRHDETPQAVKNAILALWMGLIGGVAFIASIFIGYHYIGSLSLNELMLTPCSPIILLAFACLALAAFTKSAQVPFHSWLLGAMIAPTPVSALLHSSTMVKAGVYMVLRIVPALKDTYLGLGIAAVGGLSFLVTAILAISQRESKRILAYSTIGNLGLIILCAGVNSPLAMVAAILLLVFHAMSKALLFLGAGIIENRVYSRNIEDWEGIMAKLPLTSIIMLIGMSTMFLPPFGMLVGKWLTLEAIISEVPLQWALSLVVIVVVGGVATTFFWAKWMAHLLLYPPRTEKTKIEKLQAPYLTSTITITILDVAVTILAAVLISTLIIPGIKPWYVVKLSLPYLNILTNVGAFPIWPLFIVLALLFFVGFLVVKAKGGRATPPYMCGENVVDKEPTIFRSTADLEYKLEISGMFFDRRLGEPQVDKYITLIGVFLTIFVFILTLVV